MKPLAVSLQLLARSGHGVRELERVDVGLEVNERVGRSFYAPGEMVRWVGMIGSLKVWVFAFARWGTLKVSFGEEPTALDKCAELRPAEALDVISEKVRKYVR